MTCTDGEGCGRTGFVVVGGDVRFCTCRHLRQHRERLFAGGFPPDAAEGAKKAWATGCPSAADVDAYDAFAGEFVTGKRPFRMFAFWPHETPRGLVSPAPAAARIAAFAAFLRPVVRITALDLIDAAFDRMNRATLARKAEDPETFVVVALGADAQHAYAGPLLYNLFQRRAALPSTAAQTIFTIESNYSRLSSLYGPGFTAAVSSIAPFCPCRRS